MPVLMDGKNLHTGNIKQIYLTVDVGRGVEEVKYAIMKDDSPSWFLPGRTIPYCWNDFLCSFDH